MYVFSYLVSKGNRKAEICLFGLLLFLCYLNKVYLPQHKDSSEQFLVNLTHSVSSILDGW